jgi:hypothetical protein
MIKKVTTKKKSKLKAVPSNNQDKVFQRSKDLAEKRMAKVLGVSVKELKEIKDPDVTFPAWRKVAAKDLGLDVTPDDFSEADYGSMVAYYFGITILLSAKLPLNLRQEMEKYIDVLNEIKKGFPRGKRKPGRDVQVALRMLDEGYDFPAIFPEAIENLSSMTTPEKKAAKKRLRKNVRSLKITRAVRKLRRKG